MPGEFMSPTGKLTVLTFKFRENMYLYSPVGFILTT